MKLIDCLLFYIMLKNLPLIWRCHLSLIWRCHLCRWRAAKFRAFEHGCIFIMLHLLWCNASVSSVSSKGPPHFVTSYDTQGKAENSFLPRSSQVYNDLDTLNQNVFAETLFTEYFKFFKTNTNTESCLQCLSWLYTL
jgi:hypothetical protein